MSAAVPIFLRAFKSTSTVYFLIGLVVITAIVTSLYERLQAAVTFKNGVSFPPGPPPRWFWENALPSANIACTLAGWVAQYGPVVMLRQGSHVIIIVGRVEAAAEIMEREGNALVDRPRSIAAGELLYEGLSFLLARSGERFRRFRKAAHTHLQPTAVRTYQEMQLENAKNVITDILDDPKNHRAHVQRYATSVILCLAYGKSTPTSNDDPDVTRIHQAMQNFERVMYPGAYLVDRIPLLKYIPGYGRELKEYHNFEMQLYRDQMNRVQLEMEMDHSSTSFMRTLLEHINEHGLSSNEMAYLAGNLFGAGSETTAVAITNMIMAAACYPEAQRRVQEELDTVIGEDRMPTWDDLQSLPQVHAYVLETLRWRPVTPIGFAHRATRDIIWRGQCIPAGATVIGCHWAISRDPVAFPEPERFDPQRWIDYQGRLRNHMSSYPYGFGRRACPGQHFANKSLYINLALLLWSFRIEERPDRPINPKDYTDTVVAHARPFDVEFIPRIEEGQLKEMISKSMM